MKKYFLLLTSLTFSIVAIGQQISLTNYNTEVFIENFSSNTPQFIYQKSSDNYFVVDDGDLFMSRNNKVSDFTIFSSIPFSEENYKLKTSIKLISNGSKNTYVGVLLNTQLDGNGLVSVEFNSNKEYRVRQINDGKSKYLSGNRENDGWVGDNNLKVNGEFNYVDILCVEGRYDIYFNFKYINTFESPEYTTGRFGFLIGAQSQARVDYVHVHKEGGKVTTTAFNNANDKILELENEIISLQKDIETNQTLLDQLKKEKNTISIELDDKNKDISNLSTKNDNLESKIVSLENAIKESEKAKNNITSEAEEFKSALLSYEKSTANLKQKNKDLTKQLDSKIIELSTLQTNLSNSKSELNKKTINVSELDSKLKNLNVSIENIKNTNSELKTSKTNLEKESLALNKKIANQNSQLEKANSDLVILNDQNNSLETQLTSLKSELTKIKEEKKKLNKAIISQDEENKKIKSKNSKLKNQITSLNDSKDKLYESLESANSKSSDLTKKNSTLVKNLSQSEKSLKEEENKSKNLTTKLQKSKSDNSKNSNVISQLNTKNKSINDSLNSLFISYTSLLAKEKELYELQEKFATLKNSNQENLNELEKNKTEVTRLGSQLDEQKLIAAQFAESYRYELEKSKKFQKEILDYQSELNLDAVNKTGTIYKIQLGIFDEEIDVDGLDDLTKIDTENNQFVYLSGRFESYSNARNYLLKVNGLGFKNAFIVKF